MTPLITTAVVILASAPASGGTLALARRYAAPRPKARPPLIAAVVVAQAAAFGQTAAMAGPDDARLIAGLALTWALLSLSVIDALAFRLPDVLTLPLMAAGLAAAALLPHGPVLDHLAGAAAGWGSLRLLAEVYRRWRGVDGLGLGDAKLLGAAGAWLGWRPLPAVVLGACALAFFWVGLRVAARGRGALGERLAFGLPLCVAIWIAWTFGAPPA